MGTIMNLEEFKETKKNSRNLFYLRSKTERDMAIQMIVTT